MTRALILAAGSFGPDLKERIAQGNEPRLDVFELARKLGADVIDFGDVERSTRSSVQLARKAGLSAATAWMGFLERDRYDVILTTGEDIGIPLATLMKPTASPVAHCMIAHTLAPKKKRIFFELFEIADRIDHVLAYATSEERLMKEELGFEPTQVERMYYQADEQFFTPDGTAPEPGLICAAGQLLRDYDCLIEATKDLGVRVQIAAGSPWINHKLEPGKELPSHVTWGKLNRFDLRALYRRAAIAVVPIKQNVYQTGIATILEMMSMGKCVIASKTIGQTDTIVDGKTGLYVPPGDPAALRTKISWALEHPAEAAELGRAAREFVVREAGLDLFVDKLAAAMTKARQRRERLLGIVPRATGTSHQH